MYVGWMILAFVTCTFQNTRVKYYELILHVLEPKALQSCILNLFLAQWEWGEGEGWGGRGGWRNC